MIFGNSAVKERWPAGTRTRTRDSELVCPTATQHGFTKGRSCLTNLLSFYRIAYDVADTDENYDIICMDFNKDFLLLYHKPLAPIGVIPQSGHVAPSTSFSKR